jgi:ABC-type polysaccharide/polyol phosphate export permease
MFTTLRAGTFAALADFAPLERCAILAWADIKLRYRRTKLGPFWMTLNTAFMIFSVGMVWGVIFHMPMVEYLPYFAVGMVIWNFVSATLVEGCRVFLDAHQIIKSVPNPAIMYVWRLMTRQAICLAHNVVFLAFLWAAMARPLHLGALAAIPGLALLAMSLLGAVLTLGTACARFRDIPQFVTSIVQVLFLVTPIIWSPGRMAIGTLPSVMFAANPLYNLIEVIRAPLLGHETTVMNWIVASLSAGLMFAFGVMFHGRFAKRIPYWL